jgi:ubiquitin-like modifier-activating enzyme ATG7
VHILIFYLILCVDLIIASLQVLYEYETRGFEFLLQAFNTPDYLEDITGLTQLHRETEDAEV